MTTLDILLILVLLICAGTDLKSRKIYNFVTFPTLGVTFLLHVITNGFPGLLGSLSGFFIGLGLLIIPYLMGGMGAGDVKLLSVIGAIKGVSFVLITAFYMALLGGILAILILLFRKGAVVRLKSIFYSFISLIHGVKVPLSIDRSDLTATYPYGVAIVGGAFVTLFTKGAAFPW
ncbi:prepilin peptidase [Halobacillus yeomjeoni]|uniref:A24 family peptidase n=1 Tax=Halobacillus yeomjeoni TaxID=311194 RepID=UPI001CD2D8C0|nr:prepilin peptidase [Halobacillus yeomjeoni]MCA0983417.1 prepilin peptidase [Halobacillus yeomjeoni]